MCTGEVGGGHVNRLQGCQECADNVGQEEGGRAGGGHMGGGGGGGGDGHPQVIV